MSRFLKSVLLVFAAVSVVVVIRAAAVAPPDAPIERVTFALEERAAIERFRQALRFRTISTQDGAVDTQAFLGLHEFLRTAFPLVHRDLTREVFDLGLIYRWPGRDATKSPIVLMGHLDVVQFADGPTRGGGFLPPPNAAKPRNQLS